jgi:hypothetical protein
MGMPMRSLEKRGRGLQKKDRSVFEALQKLLDAGTKVGPEDLP